MLANHNADITTPDDAECMLHGVRHDPVASCEFCVTTARVEEWWARVSTRNATRIAFGTARQASPDRNLCYRDLAYA